MRWCVTMARDDDTETVEGGNEDLRLCGLAGDDDEDLHNGREALFGHSVDVPIDVVDEPPAGACHG